MTNNGQSLRLRRHAVPVALATVGMLAVVGLFLLDVAVVGLVALIGCTALVAIGAYAAHVKGELQRANERRDELSEALTRNERVLEHENARTAAIVAAAEVGLWERNLVTQQGWVSDGFLRMLGYEPHEAHSTVGLDYVHPGDVDRVTRQLGRDAEVATDEPTEFGFRLRHRDGSYRDVRGRSLVVTRDGETIRIGAHFDVTQQHLHEAAVALVREQLEDAAHAAQVALWEWEPETHRHWTSANFEEIHGVEPKRWMLGWDEIVELDDQDRAVIQKLRRREPGSDVNHNTWKVPQANGDVRWILSRSRVSERNGVRTVLGANIDITEERSRVERLAELNSELHRSNQRMAEFSRVASHDLRSPLRAIDSLVSFIREDGDGQLNDQVLEHLAKIEIRVRRTSDLLDDLLEYSRSDAASDQPVVIDPAAMVTDILSTIETAPGVESVVECDVEQVRAEATPLAICVRNLIDNAHKHHNRESGTVIVSVGENQGFLVIDVADDGPGIEERYHEQVFEPFRSLVPAHENSGSGIGLSVIRRTVEARGGTIDLRSAPGSGSSFRLRWPIASAAGESDRGGPGSTQRVV